MITTNIDKILTGGGISHSKVMNAGVEVWSGETILYQVKVNTTNFSFAAENAYNYSNLNENPKKQTPAGLLILKYVNNTGKAINFSMSDIANYVTVLSITLAAGANEYRVVVPAVSKFYINFNVTSPQNFMNGTVVNNLQMEFKIMEQ